MEGLVEQQGSGIPIIGARVTAKTNPVYTTYSQPPNGSYRFEAIPPGSYEVTAEAYGFQSQTYTGISVVAGGNTALDFHLLPGATHVLSGTVSDATAGWPLYARLEIDGYPEGAIWTDPETGSYSVTLAADITYTVNVEAWSSGYHAEQRQTSPMTQSQTLSFDLEADANACVAPGHQRPGFYEPFENDGFPPPGWIVVDNVGLGQVWQFDNPRSRLNRTGGSGDFAIVDSDYYGGDGQQDTELRTASVDLSTLERVLLEFDTDHWTLNGNDIAEVDVSTDDGRSWANVWKNTGQSYRGPAHERIDLSDSLAGERNVMVRFHYYNASWEWWWQLDNVSVGDDQGCQTLPGGLVIGNVYDGKTSRPLMGAQVVNESGESVLTAATPLDNAVDDGFFVLFSPAGSHAFTVTKGTEHLPDIRYVQVLSSQATRQDFYLPPKTEVVHAIHLPVLLKKE